MAQKWTHWKYQTESLRKSWLNHFSLIGKIDPNTLYIQVFIDQATRYVWAFLTKRNTADTIVSCLEKILSWGIKIRMLQSDNYKSYKGTKFKKLLKAHSIKHTFTTPYQPQSNGLVEKANDTLTEKLRILVHEHPKKNGQPSYLRLLNFITKPSTIPLDMHLNSSYTVKISLGSHP